MPKEKDTEQTIEESKEILNSEELSKKVSELQKENETLSTMIRRLYSLYSDLLDRYLQNKN